MVTLVELHDRICRWEKSSEGQTSLQHSNNLGFKLNPLFSVDTWKHTWKKHLKDPKTVRNNIIWSDETHFHASCLKETRHIQSTIPKVECSGSSLMLWGCFSAAGTEGLVRVEEKFNTPKYRDSLNENPVQSIQNLRLGRRFTFQQDSWPKHTARVAYGQFWMSLSGPTRDWAWTQSNISGEIWKCASALIQPDRAWEVKRWGEE